MWYTPVALAAMRLSGMPSSAKGIREKAKRDGWEERRVPGRGGRDGTRVEYQPPPDIQRQIDELDARRGLYDSRSDAALRHAVSEAPNPQNAYEAMRRIRDASDVLQRLRKEIDYDVPATLSTILLELLAGEQITEIGARRLLDSFAAAAGILKSAPQPAEAGPTLEEGTIPGDKRRRLPEPSEAPMAWPLVKWRRRSTDK